MLVLAVIAALAREALDARLHLGAVALLALCSAAGVAVFSVAAGAYSRRSACSAGRRGDRARAAALASVAIAAGVGVVAFAIAGLPIAADSLSFGTGAGRRSRSEPAMPSRRPCSATWSAIYRSTKASASGSATTTVTRSRSASRARAATVLFVLAALLVIVAAVVELRRRRLAVILALAPALLVYVLAAPRLSPYADAKLLVALSPMARVRGRHGRLVARTPRTAAGLVAAVLLAGGVLISDAIAYHHAQLAPVERLLALRDAVDHTPRSRPCADYGVGGAREVLRRRARAERRP